MKARPSCSDVKHVHLSVVEFFAAHRTLVLGSHTVLYTLLTEHVTTRGGRQLLLATLYLELKETKV